ncbi:MAG TPA: hypothetical protein PKB14_17305 [Rubrivivax sp.]|nr:hypothetical protein [Rubrivivax sp.]
MAEDDAPARKCWRCSSHTQDQLDYERAIAQGLPIGWGEIESAHRCIIRKRLKLPGAWRQAANAGHMLVLRLNRANGERHSYWDRDLLYAA